HGLTVPPLPAGMGVTLSGKIPHWLYTGLALAYRAAPWIAVYQPQIEAAVVCHTLGDPPIGARVSSRYRSEE
ncbi:MAG TPA: hypothetical protein ENF52_01685, partial [Chloroflexi bacterium]|nr:hypothetical protein [Chloroflexota bacterium]